MSTVPALEVAKKRLAAEFEQIFLEHSLANILQGQLGRTVIDKTEARGLYDFVITFSSDPAPLPPPVTENLLQALARLREALPPRLEEQLGLKLEPARAATETLIVEDTERPSEN